MYILRPDIPEDQVEDHLKKYSGILEKTKAEIIDNQMRGKRRLAYPIGKHKEGIYVQLSHTGDGKHVETLEKSMRLSEDVIRYLTVKQYGSLPTKKHTKSNDKEETKTLESEKIEANTDTKAPEDNKKAEEAKSTEDEKKSDDIKKPEETKKTNETKTSEPIKESNTES